MERGEEGGRIEEDRRRGGGGKERRGRGREREV
jgi:hypothetical protein